MATETQHQVRARSATARYVTARHMHASKDFSHRRQIFNMGNADLTLSQDDNNCLVLLDTKLDNSGAPRTLTIPAKAGFQCRVLMAHAHASDTLGNTTDDDLRIECSGGLVGTIMRVDTSGGPEFVAAEAGDDRVTFDHLTTHLSLELYVGSGDSAPECHIQGYMADAGSGSVTFVTI